MKTINKLYKLLVMGGAVVLAGALQSCDDFLTVTPTNQITDEEFWKDRSDVDAVRAAAYKKMIDGDQLSKVLIWGELRSDNFKLAKLNNQGFYNMTHAILMPTEGMFNWAGMYSGINICNLVLQRGERMIENNTDPTFSEGDWKPIKAEMMALRSLYYFYLVRAFRDVPFVTDPVTTDKEAMEKRNVEATPGVAILGNALDSLEVAKGYAAKNFGFRFSNKGRFTQRGIYALMADMYLWRACLLNNMIKHVQKDGVTGVTRVNLDDKYGAPQADANAATADNTQTSDKQVLYTADGKLINKAFLVNLRDKCLQNTVACADFVINDIKKEQELENLKAGIIIEKPEKYPLIQNFYMGAMSEDVVYYSIFARKNSIESVLEWQFDGATNSNTVYEKYLTKASNGILSSVIFDCNENLVNRNNVEPQKGFGKTDYRMLETMEVPNKPPYPFAKNLRSSLNILDPKDVANDKSLASLRSSNDANWPVYRLTDIMLIKAEALARMGVANNSEEIYDAFDMVNAIFQRCNPALHPENKNSSSQDGAEYGSTRLNFLEEHMLYGSKPGKDDKYYAKDKNAGDLLNLVYNERRREFIGEGKYWFDIVRQAEWSNDPEGAIATYTSFPKAIAARLRKLESLYNPIFNEEYKLIGVEFGGKLKQNPIWARYATN